MAPIRRADWWHDGPLGPARNAYVVSGDGSVSLVLTQGFTTRVSVARFAEVAPVRWCANATSPGNYYVVNAATRTHMQVFLCGRGGWKVDHRDGDTMNNTDSNLRRATNSQNRMNSGRNRNNTSGYKGVHYHPQGWRAVLGAGGKHVFLGYFASPEEAARAYDEAAVFHHGPFARTNESLGLLPTVLVLPVPEPMAAD